MDRADAGLQRRHVVERLVSLAILDPAPRAPRASHLQRMQHQLFERRLEARDSCEFGGDQPEQEIVGTAVVGILLTVRQCGTRLAGHGSRRDPAGGLRRGQRLRLVEIGFHLADNRAEAALVDAGIAFEQVPDRDFGETVVGVRAVEWGQAQDRLHLAVVRLLRVVGERLPDRHPAESLGHARHAEQCRRVDIAIIGLGFGQLVALGVDQSRPLDDRHRRAAEIVGANIILHPLVELLRLGLVGRSRPTGSGPRIFQTRGTISSLSAKIAE